jgi:hypothetical protein
LRTGDTPQAFNGFGFSFQATALPGLKLGGAYNKTYFNSTLRNTVLHGGTDYWVFGGQGTWRNLEWGADYVHQNNGDLVFIPEPTGGPLHPLRPESPDQPELQDQVCNPRCRMALLAIRLRVF